MSLESHAKMNRLLSVVGVLVLVIGLGFGLRSMVVVPTFIALTLTQLSSWLWLKRRATRTGLRVIAAEAQVCVKCEYPLQQGETWLHCPECGHQTDPNESWRDWHNRLTPHGYSMRLPWLHSDPKQPEPWITLRSLERVQIVAGAVCVASLLGIVLGYLSLVTLTMQIVGLLALIVSTVWWKIQSQIVLSRLRLHEWKLCPRCEAPLQAVQGSLECGPCRQRYAEADAIREWEKRLDSWRLRDRIRIPPPTNPPDHRG